jgi:toxin FitB
VIVVDTNILSELSKPTRSQAVITWLDAQAAESLYVTTINVAELLAGVALLPTGRRKDTLQADVMAMLDRMFGLRVLSFDLIAAKTYAEQEKRTPAAGKALLLGDALIAAIAAAHGYAVATRDVAPFEAAGLAIINPWKE